MIKDLSKILRQRIRPDQGIGNDGEIPIRISKMCSGRCHFFLNTMYEQAFFRLYLEPPFTTILKNRTNIRDVLHVEIVHSDPLAAGLNFIATD
ncbi:hypothetical protein BK658_22190 [Pseudomonas brassicacearum]|uniref:Uncharacterized protein n=1 Tax=Pseudomonas brassicacearum TaxID=930166 RepID=A0A423GLE9_9PSED|nr:hypothetical protein BK658_22190 [Pseudomonas brassicacearum]